MSLQRVTPEEWRERVLHIEDETVRGAVACVVWWDFVAGQPWNNRNTHLDGLMTSADRINNEQMYAGLTQVGYPAGRAAARITQGRCYNGKSKLKEAA